MAWKIELSTLAQKNLEQLDPPIARRILSFLSTRVSALDDPRSIGEALTGSQLGQFWKYRVGDYRIISKIEDREIRILIVKIGHRREVYG
jgi:mRNA interferase RelE/StbE